MPVPPIPNILIVGAGGLVGRELLGLLERGTLPHGMIRLVGGGSSIGRPVPFCGAELMIEDGRELGARMFDDVDLAFLCAGGDASRSLAPMARDAGVMVIDNSSAFRMDPACPLIVPEVNRDQIPAPDQPSIIANPNCSTILALLAIAPIDTRFGVEHVIASTYQAVSGGGHAMLTELIEQTRAWARSIPDDVASSDVDPLAWKPDGWDAEKASRRAMHFNLFSHDSPMTDGSNEEEHKMQREMAKICSRPDLNVSVTCVRTPTPRAHAIALTMRTREGVRVDALTDVLTNAPGITIVDNPAVNLFPEPMAASNRDDALVGRIRVDHAFGTTPTGDALGCSVFVAGDQIRKGAALNAFQIAVELTRRSSVL